MCQATSPSSRNVVSAQALCSRKTTTAAQVTVSSGASRSSRQAARLNVAPATITIGSTAPIASRPVSWSFSALPIGPGCAPPWKRS